MGQWVTSYCVNTDCARLDKPMPLDPAVNLGDEEPVICGEPGCHRHCAVADANGVKRVLPELSELELVEREHGFVFGNPDPIPPTPQIAAVNCRTPGCDRLNRQYVIHEDTILPVYCGGCGRLLYCDHAHTKSPATLEGTLGRPLHVQVTSCVVCGMVLDRVETPIPPDQVPLGGYLQAS